MVDTQGWLLKVVVSAADVADRVGARLLAQAQRCFGPALPRLTHVWADSAYAGQFVTWAKETMGWTVEIVKRADDAPDRPAPKGFAVQPHRWIVERTFGWWSELHRLAKDFEYQLESSEAMIYVGMIHLMLRRLARAPG